MSAEFSLVPCSCYELVDEWPSRSETEPTAPRVGTHRLLGSPPQLGVYRMRGSWPIPYLY